MGIAALLGSSTATGASLLTPYNVIVSGSFADSNTDVGGGLAVGGSATLGGFTLGSNLLNEPLTDFPNSATFIAAGGVTGEAAMATGNSGNYYFTGTDPTFYDNATVKGTLDGKDPITFTTAFAQFTSLSATWSTAAATSGDGCTAAGSVTTCTVTKAGLNIIDVADSLIASGQTIHITGASSASWVILNVTGATDTLSGNMTINGSGNNGDSSPAGADDVLFNFYQATKITLGGSSMGSVLAPNAAVTGDGGQFVGSLVAASFAQGTNGGTEFHNYYFQGGTPEPAPAAFVGAGLIALALLRKHRRH
ncbi:MAG: choice-of-anchor A family protein [Bryobacteraceae bacterium]